jgi:hypothetical protein
VSHSSKLKHNFGSQGGPFKPQNPNLGAKNMSDKNTSSKDFTKAGVMEQSDVSTLRLALFEKENLELKQQLLQGNVERAQLQAQLQGDKLKEALEKAQKTIEGLVAVVNKKYGIDLTKEKVDLTTGAITRDVPAATDEEAEE